MKFTKKRYFKKFLLMYKLIIKLFFLSIYGKVKFNEKSIHKRLNVKKVFIENKSYKIFEIDNCRVYTNTSDTAFILNNYIISGPSIQLRNNTNSSVKNNVVIKNGTPKICKKINKKAYSLLSGFDCSNYYHWFFNLISNYFLLKKKYRFKEDDFFLIPKLKYNFQIESLKILKIKNTINSDHIKHMKLKKIIVPEFKDFNKNPVGKTDWIVKDLQNEFLPYANVKKHKLKIFIDRNPKNTNQRDIYNKKDLLDFLKKKNFLIIDPSTLSFKKEVKLFNSTKTIIGIYGAGLVNVIFCKKNTNVIELRNNFNDDLYKNLILKCKLNYFSLKSNLIKNNYSTSRKFDGLIEVDISKLSQILKNIL